MPPCYLQHGRVYTNHLNPDTIKRLCRGPGGAARSSTGWCPWRQHDDGPGDGSRGPIYVLTLPIAGEQRDRRSCRSATSTGRVLLDPACHRCNTVAHFSADFNVIFFAHWNVEVNVIRIANALRIFSASIPARHTMSKPKPWPGAQQIAHHRCGPVLHLAIPADATVSAGSLP
jgi:hypothetical protein